MREMAFVDEYCKDWQAGAAAIRAGYAAAGARVAANKLLRRPRVLEALHERQRALAATYPKINPDTVLEELRRIAKSDVRKLFDRYAAVVPPRDLPDDVAAAVSSIKVVDRTEPREDEDGNALPPIVTRTYEYKFWDKVKAIELIMKHLGMLVDRFRIEDPDQVLARVLGVERAQLPAAVIRGALPGEVTPPDVVDGETVAQLEDGARVQLEDVDPPAPPPAPTLVDWRAVVQLELEDARP